MSFYLVCASTYCATQAILKFEYLLPPLLSYPLGGLPRDSKTNNRGTQRQFLENICSEDDLRSGIFGTFVVKFLACLPFLGFSNI